MRVIITYTNNNFDKWMVLRQAYNYQESASAETFTALVSRRERGG